MNGCVAGVDGGGTRTRVVVADAEGRPLARVEGAGSLVDATRPDLAAGVVASVTRRAAREAGVDVPLRAVYAALAGTGRESVRVDVERALVREGIAGRVRVDTDVRAAFHRAFGTGPGILLVSGTGSIGWGRSESGREGRVGGWGTVIGDEGSGYGIGREALRRVARAADGRGPETGLTRAVLDFLDLERPEELVEWAQRAGKGGVAALVSPVVAQADGGDSVAGEILVGAVEELEGHVLTLVSTLGPWSRPPRVAFSGGLLEEGGPLRRGVETVLSHHALKRTESDPDPVLGAVDLALALD